MRVPFDTCVLVAAVVSQLPGHTQALACYRKHRGSGRSKKGYCTTLALAEAYATLTALPLAPRIQPTEAALLLRRNFTRDLAVLPLSTDDYTAAVERIASLGLSSGAVYDALHLIAAERQKCERLFTSNLADFNRLLSESVESVEIVAP